MLPSIRKRIDDANNKTIEFDGIDKEVHRISIPSSEMVALGELRKSEQTRRVREALNTDIADIMEAEARARVRSKENDAVAGIDMVTQRPFGLHQGEACTDIWGLIFEHVDDAEDVANLRDTCEVFREMLERKYRTLRFIQVALKFSNIFGGREFLMDFRRVCKTSKTAVDLLFAKDRINDHFDIEPFESHYEEYCVPKRSLEYLPHEEGLSAAGMLARLQRLKPDPSRFPVKLASLMEIRSDDLNNRFALHDDIINNPVLPSLRTTFQKLVELVGSSFRNFHYTSVLDRPDTYSQLRSWVEFMPSLEVLFVEINEESINNGNPPGLDITPFPSCPKLKRYVHSSCGFSAPLVAKIFHANPWISDVFAYYMPGGDREEEFTSFLTTLTALQLEKFKLLGGNTIPPPEVLQLRTEWPLKSLSLIIFGQDHQDRETPSSTLFAFVNRFNGTLEELQVNWKIKDTGGFLDTPKVCRLCWKLWPNFMTLEFMVVLESLRYLDVDVEECQDINGSFENVQGFFDENNFPPIFPVLKRIRARMEAGENWHIVWKA